MSDLVARLKSALRRRGTAFRRNDEGATAVEYGLMVALIAGVIIVAVTQLGGEVKKGFDKTCGAIQNANATAPASAAPANC